MNFQDKVKEMYDEQCSENYVESDKLATSTIEHYGGMLRQICSTFDHKISVLDVGCGTGRYFHCLTNVKKLLGIDISPYMLEKARDPIKREEIDVDDIELLCGDIFCLDIPFESFDFVYSIGVLGEYSPFNLYICNRLFGLLKPNGKLFFTVTDAHSRMQDFGDEQPNIGKRALRKIFPVLPLMGRRYVNRRLSSFFLTREEIEGILGKSAFAEYKIWHWQHPKKIGWQGSHYDCLALKNKAIHPIKV